MAPAIGRPALDNGSCGSIPGDWVALPPQNIQRRKHMKKTKETKTKDDHILSREDRIRESQEFNLLSDVFLSVALDDAPACQHIIREECVITAHWLTVNFWQRERNTMNCRTGCSFTSARQTSGNRERQSTQ